MAKLEVYSLGLLHLSVCTDAVDRKEIERLCNKHSPAGTEQGWLVSEEPTFKGGEPNPNPCNKGRKGFLHYLMVC